MFEIESNPVLLYPFSIFLFNYIRNRLLHTHNFFYLAHVFGEIRMIDIWERRIIFQIIFHNKLSPRILNISIFHILQTWMIFTNYFQYFSSIIQNLIILIIILNFLNLITKMIKTISTRTNLQKSRYFIKQIWLQSQLPHMFLTSDYTLLISEKNIIIKRIVIKN